MKKPNKSDRFALLGEWLEIWRSEGGPIITDPDWGDDCETSYDSDVFVIKYDDNGCSHSVKLNLRLGEHSLTSLFCRLQGEKLCSDGSMYLLSSGYPDTDAGLTERDASYIHMEAALAYKDVEAVYACDPDYAKKLEIKWMRSVMCDASQPNRQRRL